jgi:hypothetical protein
MSTTIPNADALRRNAHGLYHAEAAADLFLDSGLASRFPIPEDGAVDYAWLLILHGTVLSGGERRLLSICASLVDYAVQLSLADVTSGLDELHQELVVRAIAHAMGRRPEGWVPPGALEAGPR